MPRFAANLSLLYPELPFLDRFEAAARDGFPAVEFQFPYEFSAEEIAARARAHDLEVVLFNAPPGQFAAGERGLAALPGRESEFQAGLREALRYAQVLRCPRLHVMSGIVAEPSQRAAMRATLVANLRWAAAQAQPHRVDLLVEPINTRDFPGYFLNRQDEAHALLAEIGAPNLKVQFDLYHCQVVEGDVAMKIRHYLPTGRVGHFQVAGAPQRQEPDVGELNAAYLFEVIDEVAAQCGWQGWVGCEYRPARGAVANGTTQGLGWLRRLRAGS